MSFDSVRSAYGSRAAEYIDAVGMIEHATEVDREHVLEWARSVTGRVIDVGSGPGQWTDYLRREGVEIEGLEPVPAFLADARRQYPSSRYREGRAEHLGVADGSLGGILAWYSLIHTEPSAIDLPLEEFARALAPGGSLLVGFFTGAKLAPFEHAISTAYYWPVDLLAERLESAGFTVTATRARFDPEQTPGPGKRPEAIMTSVRMPRSARDA